MSDSVWDWLHDYTWKLYEDGHADMAEKIDDFSGIAYNKDQESVEAAYPELVAFARQQKNPWLEVYLRHWRLQAYVNTNHDPRPLVPEVLDLLAFTQGEDVRDCPQSTCVIDDITDIYAAIDAPGFAEERVNMLEETLKTLPERRECYVCMVMSMVDALVDLGKSDAALEVWRKGKAIRTEMSETGDFSGHFNRYLATFVVRAYVAQEQHTAALEMLDQSLPNDDSAVATVQALYAIIYMALDLPDKAREAFARLKDIGLEDIDIEHYVKAVRAIGGDILADPDVMAQLRDMTKLAQERGRVREAFDAAALIYDMSMGVSDLDVATKAVNVMDAVLPELNRPLGADRVLEAARERMSN